MESINGFGNILIKEGGNFPLGREKISVLSDQRPACRVEPEDSGVDRIWGGQLRLVANQAEMKR